MVAQTMMAALEQSFCRPAATRNAALRQYGGMFHRRFAPTLCGAVTAATTTQGWGGFLTSRREPPTGPRWGDHPRSLDELT